MAKEELLVVLEDIGLSKNQAKIYLKLIELGPSSVGQLSEKIEVHRTNIYDALEKLIEQGLVSYILKGKTKHFQASAPKALLSVLKGRVNRFKSILPQLQLNDRFGKQKEQATLYEGVKGIKAITDDILHEGKDVLTFGVPRNMAERIKLFVLLFHQRRIQKKIHMKHLYDADAPERLAYLNALPHTEARYLPAAYDSPATTTVYGEKVTFFIWSDPPVGILIHSKRMADQYRYYFGLLWEKAKK